MNLSKICIERPVLTVVLSLILILMGVMAFTQLDLQADPTVFRPNLSITVNAPGSSAQYVEENIVIPLENKLQSTDNLTSMRSTSSQDAAQIKLQFKKISREEFVNVQSQVLQAVNETDLPDNAQTPRIEVGNNTGTPLLFVAVSSSRMDQQHLVDYVQNHIVRRLQQVPGVGSVDQYSTEDALRINLLPKKMAELGVSVDEVTQALKDNNQSLQAGQILTKDQAIPINLNSRLTSIEQFQNIIVKRQGDHLVRFKDIANIQIDHESYAGAYTYYRDKQGVGISISSSDNANPITVGKNLRGILKAMSANLPPGVHFHMIWDQANIIQHSVEEVFYTILESILFVAAVTLLFLGRWRFALIPVVTIPVCMIASFAAVWLLGFSINLMTLLALVLAVGLVVDDAIVVLENCHRHLEAGMGTFAAAIKSMKEITFPVIGMTLSIVAVYLPTAFMSGKSAVYFQQFSFTLAFAVLISGFVALTLTPMMCARLMKTGGHSRVDNILETIFGGIRKGYGRALTWTIHHLWAPLLVFVLVLGVGIYAFKGLPTTLLPKEYAGFIFTMIKTPDSASVAYTERAAKKIIHDVMKMPVVGNMVSFGGGMTNSSNMGLSFIQLKKKYQDTKDNIKIARMITAKFMNFSPAKVFAIPLNINSRHNSGQPGQLSFYVSGYTSYPNLARIVAKFVTQLKKTGDFLQVDNGLKYSSQQYDITIDREKAAALDVPIENITSAVSTFFGGYTIEDGYQFNGINYPVIVQLPVDDMKDFSALNNIYLFNQQKIAIPLARVLTIKPTINLPARTHNNGMRAAQVDIVPNPKIPSGQVVDEVQKIAKDTLPAGINLDYTQQILDIMHGNNTMMWIFILGLIFVYLIFGALFESFIDPLIILLTVPLCIVAALFALKFIGGSLNIYSDIGLVTLIGLVSKHGVLITQFANGLREEGKSIKEAVIEASTIRIRPILMTTATMIMGAIPLLMASGPGSNGRHQIGWVVVAGLLLGTVFSLFIVPIAYSLLAKLKKG